MSINRDINRDINDINRDSLREYGYFRLEAAGRPGPSLITYVKPRAVGCVG
jgi:hypothetical protein